MLIRKNTAPTLFSLPKLATNCFKYGVTIGFTGSVIRKVTNSLGITNITELFMALMKKVFFG